ncbi:MAG: Luciferase-like monooxygenase [Candidatus Binatus sp.]|jgi:probable F420-dependent oxidoreductase|nr:Luciferase-like monooxygenase [Candidatus Binatus sp.]
MAEKNTSRLRFGLWYDFRNPTQWQQPFDRLYHEILDQIAWAETLGYEDLWLSEHHFIDDGYSPSLLPIAAAAAARTKTLRIATGVVLAPFHNPVRLAEDVATVDVISGGRFELGIGVGYKVEEFEGFAIDFKERGSRTNELLEIVRRLLEGETLSFKGKYFAVNNARVTPQPIQKPRPPIWVGGFTPAAMRRVARYGDGFMGPPIPLKSLYELYSKELTKLGKPVANAPIAGGYSWLIASEDPEKTWNEAADHVLYQTNLYAEWNARAANVPVQKIRDREELKALNVLRVADPETCIKLIRAIIADVPLTHYLSWTLPPGLPPKWVAPHLELFAKKVIPAFR